MKKQWLYLLLWVLSIAVGLLSRFVDLSFVPFLDAFAGDTYLGIHDILACQCYFFEKNDIIQSHYITYFLLSDRDVTIIEMGLVGNFA